MRGEMEVIGQVGDVEVKDMEGRVSGAIAAPLDHAFSALPAQQRARVQAFMANFGAAFERWTKEDDKLEMGHVEDFEDEVEVAMGFVEELEDEQND